MDLLKNMPRDSESTKTSASNGRADATSRSGRGSSKNNCERGKSVRFGQKRFADESHLKGREHLKAGVTKRLRNQLAPKRLYRFFSNSETGNGEKGAGD